MKNVLTFILLSFALTVTAANPFEQRFAWQPSPTTNITRYVLHTNTNGPAVTNWHGVAVTNASWTNLLAGITNGWLKTNFVAGVTNWVMLTARDASGVESEPSNVIHFVPPKPAGQLRLILQWAPTINGPWQDIPTAPPVDLPMTETALFSRIIHAPP